MALPAFLLPLLKILGGGAAKGGLLGQVGGAAAAGGAAKLLGAAGGAAQAAPTISRAAGGLAGQSPIGGAQLLRQGAGGSLLGSGKAQAGGQLGQFLMGQMQQRRQQPQQQLQQIPTGMTMPQAQPDQGGSRWGQVGNTLLDVLAGADQGAPGIVRSVRGGRARRKYQGTIGGLLEDPTLTSEQKARMEFMRSFPGQYVAPRNPHTDPFELLGARDVLSRRRTREKEPPDKRIYRMLERGMTQQEIRKKHPGLWRSYTEWQKNKRQQSLFQAIINSRGGGAGQPSADDLNQSIYGPQPGFE